MTDFIREFQVALWKGATIEYSIMIARNKLYNQYSSTLEWAGLIVYRHPGGIDSSVNGFLLHDAKVLGISPLQFLAAHGLGKVPTNKEFFVRKAESLTRERVFQTIVIPPLQIDGESVRRLQGRHEATAELLEEESAFFCIGDGLGATTYCYLIKDTASVKKPRNIVAMYGIDENMEINTIDLHKWIKYVKRVVCEDIIKEHGNEFSGKIKDPIISEKASFLKEHYQTNNLRQEDNQDYWIEDLSQIVKEFGYSGIYLILYGSMERVNALVGVEKIRIKGFSLKIFTRYNEISEVKKRFTSYGDIKIYYIDKWSDVSLNKFSDRLFGYYGSIGDKPFESAKKFSDLCNGDEAINQRLINASGGSPRYLIEIMENIIKMHCAIAEDPNELISMEIVDRLL